MNPTHEEAASPCGIRRQRPVPPVVFAVDAEEPHEEQPKAYGEEDGHSDMYEPSIMDEAERSKNMFDLNMPEVLDDELEEAAVQQSVHEEFGEQGQRVSQSVPVSPTLQEVRDHSVCHMPYRSWCAHCVRGRG